MFAVYLVVWVRKSGSFLLLQGNSVPFLLLVQQQTYSTRDFVGLLAYHY